jgi:transposase
MWCIAELDEEYIACMEDVLAVYEQPHCEEEPVVCVDEKPVVLHADVRPPRPARPGRIARRDSEYRREGTANVFCGVEPKAGRHFTRVTPNRSSPQFADFLVEIASQYPKAKTIHLVMDNLSSHTRKALTDSFGEQIGGWIWNRFTPHYTPKHGSWLNQAEIEIGLFSRQCLGERRIPTLQDLEREAGAWNETINRHRVLIH